MLLSQEICGTLARVHQALSGCSTMVVCLLWEQVARVRFSAPRLEFL